VHLENERLRGEIEAAYDTIKAQSRQLSHLWSAATEATRHAAGASFAASLRASASADFVPPRSALLHSAPYIGGSEVSSSEECPAPSVARPASGKASPAVGASALSAARSRPSSRSGVGGAGAPPLPPSASVVSSPALSAGSCAGALPPTPVGQPGLFRPAVRPLKSYLSRTMLTRLGPGVLDDLLADKRQDVHADGDSHEDHTGPFELSRACTTSSALSPSNAGKWLPSETGTLRSSGSGDATCSSTRASESSPAGGLPFASHAHFAEAPARRKLGDRPPSQGHLGQLPDKVRPCGGIEAAAVAAPVGQRFGSGAVGAAAAESPDVGKRLAPRLPAPTGDARGCFLRSSADTCNTDAPPSPSALPARPPASAARCAPPPSPPAASPLVTPPAVSQGSSLLAPQLGSAPLAPALSPLAEPVAGTAASAPLQHVPKLRRSSSSITASVAVPGSSAGKTGDKQMQQQQRTAASSATSGRCTEARTKLAHAASARHLGGVDRGGDVEKKLLEKGRSSEQLLDSRQIDADYKSPFAKRLQSWMSHGRGLVGAGLGRADSVSDLSFGDGAESVASSMGWASPMSRRSARSSGGGRTARAAVQRRGAEETCRCMTAPQTARLAADRLSEASSPSCFASLAAIGVAESPKDIVTQPSPSKLWAASSERQLPAHDCEERLRPEKLERKEREWQEQLEREERQRQAMGSEERRRRELQEREEISRREHQEREEREKRERRDREDRELEERKRRELEEREAREKDRERKEREERERKEREAAQRKDREERERREREEREREEREARERKEREERERKEREVRERQEREERERKEREDRAQQDREAQEKEREERHKMQQRGPTTVLGQAQKGASSSDSEEDKAEGAQSSSGSDSDEDSVAAAAKSGAKPGAGAVAVSPAARAVAVRSSDSDSGSSSDAGPPKGTPSPSAARLGSGALPVSRLSPTSSSQGSAWFAGSPASAASRQTEFTVNLIKAGRSLGVDITTTSNSVLISKITMDGLISEWNKKNPQHQVAEGDEIVGVNGMRGSGDTLKAGIIQTTSELTLVFRKGLSRQLSGGQRTASQPSSPVAAQEAQQAPSSYPKPPSDSSSDLVHNLGIASEDESDDDSSQKSGSDGVSLPSLPTGRIADTE